MALEKDLEQGPKKLHLAKRTSNKNERFDTQSSEMTSFDKRKDIQEAKAMFMNEQRVNPFVPMMKSEEDFINPEPNNNHYMQIDNSQLYNENRT
mmetsp:Transcript_34865/g.31378  ORF Transcript_34865/g.31378 Transcript_34865/m.31378 type:complete len:94 (-) Transcript_34865:631-912(-)